MGTDKDTNLHIVLLQNTINMTIHQLSIFIENKNGTLLRVLDILKEAKIQIIASTISDTVDYGIFRIICSNPSQAYELLQEHGLSVTISDVFAIEHQLHVFVPRRWERHHYLPYRRHREGT